MKKIIKIITLIFAPIILAINRVFALTAEGTMAKYGVAPIQSLYGVVAPTDTISSLFKLLVVPIALIIFLFIGIRKLRKNKKKIKQKK